MRRISMAARDELVAAVADRYARGDRGERGRILDEFAAVTGYHRKHAMRLLRAGRVNRRCGPRPGRRIYDEAAREALIVVWEHSPVRQHGFLSRLPRYRKVFPTIPSPLPRVTIGYKRVPMYRFPPLAECRRRFAEEFGQSLGHLWGDAQEDWDTEDEPSENYPIGKRW
jgi:hypothetical protein